MSKLVEAVIMLLRETLRPSCTNEEADNITRIAIELLEIGFNETGEK